MIWGRIRSLLLILIISNMTESNIWKQNDINKKVCRGIIALELLPYQKKSWLNSTAHNEISNAFWTLWAGEKLQYTRSAVSVLSNEWTSSREWRPHRYTMQVKNTLYVSVANKAKENHFLLSIMKSCSCVLILFWPKILKAKVISSSIKSIGLVPGRWGNQNNPLRFSKSRAVIGQKLSYYLHVPLWWGNKRYKADCLKFR